MIIYSKTGSIILDIEVDDTSYRYRAIRQGDKVYLYFSLTEHVEIPTYSFINYQGQRYTLWKPENLTKNGERDLDYVVEFGGYWEILNRTKYKFLSGKPHKLKFPLTAKPRMFMQLLVDNLNLHDSGWTLGTCIDAPEKTLTFSHENCMAVLNRLADEYNTEFEFISKTINFGKVERFKDDPLPLSYGKGNGFKTGVVRQSQGDKAPITILYVQGGERNIDFSTYGSASLLLPKNQELEYQGRRYKTDPDGMYITRADRPTIDFNEDGYDASNIYPSRVGTISQVITVNASKNFYDIKDSSIPAALDYSKCRIAGEKATIIFQSGILAGREFDLEQTDDALTGYVHSERRFKIVPIEQDGTIMPNETFKPAVGDKYAIFNISLPQAYVCDNASQSGASWDMFKEAVRYMYENEEESFTFKGDLDSLWSKKKWSDIAAKLEPGSYIQFSDTQFQPEGILIRITGIKDYINKPYAPEIELSNTPVAGYVSSELGKIDSNEVKDEDRYNNSIYYTKRSWKDVKETQKMMFDPDGSFKQEYTASLLAEFGHLVIGMKSQQMDLIGVKFIPNADGNANSFKSTAGKLVHFTIKDTPTEWTIPASSHTLSGSLYYYVYAKCSRTGSSGSIYVTNQQIKFDSDSSYYYFWIGTLNTPEDNVRSWLPLYGYTEIAGQTITTGIIKDKLARLVIDLVKGTITGPVTFTAGSSGYNNIKDKPNLDPIYDGISDALQEAENASNAANNAANTANNASNAAGNATNIANSKSTVYYYKPSSGQKTNDLWVDGTNIWRWNGSSWVYASAYDNTKTKIDGGVITTGAIAFGGTGGMAGSGSVRIWSGGTAAANGNPPSKPTFRVLNTGSIYGQNSIICEDKNGNPICGFSSEGTNWGGANDRGSLRIWSGASFESRDTAPFRVYMNGYIYTPMVNLGNSSTLSNTSLYLPNNGQIICRGGAREAMIVSGDNGYNNLVKLTDTGNDANALLDMRIGNATTAFLPRKWIICGHKEGWGSGFTVESRYFGDTNSMTRTCIIVNNLATKSQLENKGIVSNPVWTNLVWDTKSGHLAMDY